MQLDHAISLLLKERRAIRREKCRQKIKGPGIAVCSNKRRLIQKRFHQLVPKVFGPRGGRLRHERGPRRDLQEPLRGMIVGE